MPPLVKRGQYFEGKMKKITTFLKNLSTIKKILFGFLLIVSISAIPGIYSEITIANVTAKNNLVLSDKIPLQQASLRANNLLTSTLSSLKAFVLETKDLEELDKTIHHKIENFNLLLLKMRDGSNSKTTEEFKANYPEGMEDLTADLILPPQQNAELREKLDIIIEKDLPLFQEQVDLLIDAHTEKVSYHLTHDDLEYNIASFASKIFINFRNWVNDLEKSVRYNVPFKGEVDGSKTDFGRWYPNSTIQDPKINKRLDKLNSLTNRIYRIAAEIDKAPAAAKMVIYNAQNESDFKRYESEIARLIRDATLIYTNLSKKETENIEQSEQISETIQNQLSALRLFIINDVNNAKQASQSAATAALTVILLAILFCAGLSVILGLAIGKSIANPLSKITENMKKLAGGSLDVTITDTERKDEIGDMSKAMNVFKENMIERERLEEQQKAEDRKQLERSERVEKIVNAFDIDMSQFVETLSNSIMDMQLTSSDLNELASQGNRNSSTLTGASDKVSQNVEVVASASEELSATSQSVADQIKNTNTLIMEAVQKTDAADVYAENLTAASGKVQDVLSIISDISEQINLLALNATIESARAGEAGKGFAVVANEVKNLATETNNSITEIQTVINEMQDVSTGMIDALKEVKDIIQNVNEVSDNIANSVNEQTQATSEIASNMVSVSSETQSVSKTVTDVSADAQKTGEASTSLKSAADRIGTDSESLKEKVKQFFADIKAA